MGAPGAFIGAEPDKVWLDRALFANSSSEDSEGIEFWARILLHETANWVARAVGRTPRASRDFHLNSGETSNDAGLAFDECFANEPVPWPTELREFWDRIDYQKLMNGRGDPSATAYRHADPNPRTRQPMELFDEWVKVFPFTISVTVAITYGPIVPDP